MAKTKSTTPVKPKDLTRQKKTESEKIKIVGMRIKEHRRKLGYSSGLKFAFENGLEPATYARHEAGNNMTLSTLFKIAQALKISVSELLKDL